MLKKHSILASFLLAVSLAACKQQSETNQASQGEHPPPNAAATTRPKQDDSTGLKSQSTNDQQGDKPIIVSVVSSPDKDWYDKSEVWINGVLVLIGFGGIVVAVCTLRRIERQTIATEICARATRKSVEITANAGRAWIVPEGRFLRELHDFAHQGLPTSVAWL